MFTNTLPMKGGHNRTATTASFREKAQQELEEIMEARQFGATMERLDREEAENLANGLTADGMDPFA